MSAQTLLSGGDKYFAYSGEVFGDVSVPATIQLILIPNTGLRDSYVKIQPYYGIGDSTATSGQLGIQVKLDDVVVFNSQGINTTMASGTNKSIELFVPRQSKIEIISLNKSANNTQTRGANLIGYYL